ncbi:MAG: hypothetical protein EOP04_25070 [Proteobacteria bacterium]|nr:MAG: hypothetical protein EOP04_25070 [Pseudomonadota bacterium]
MTGSTQSSHIKVDMTFPSLIKEIQDLTKSQLQELLESTVKLQKITWKELWEQSTKGKGKTGFNYELIEEDPDLGNIHSIRITKSFRARVIRENEWMRFISLHPDHDSAYR